MKIANKISLSFLLLVMILAAITTATFYLIAKKYFREAIYNQLIAVGTSRTNHIETYLEMLRTSVVQASRSVVLPRALRTNKDDPGYQKALEDAARLLQSKLEGDVSICEYLLLDASGRVVTATDESSIGLAKSGDPIFLGAKNGAFIKDAYFSAEKKLPLIAISAPVFENKGGDFLGVLVARVKLDELNRILTNRKGLWKTGEVYVINKYGYMITPSRFKKGTFLRQKTEVEASCALCHAVMTDRPKKALPYQDKESVSFSHAMPYAYPDYRGIRVLGVYNYLPQMQWGVLAEIDEKEAFEPLLRMRFIVLAIFFALPFFAWLLGVFIAGLITDSLRRLQKGVEIISSGNSDYKVDTHTNDEVGQFSRAFDVMIKDLRETTISKDYLDNIMKSMADSLIVIDPDSKITTVNKATCDLLGYKGKELIGNDVSFLFPADAGTEAERDVRRKKFLKDGVLRNQETCYKTKDGKMIPIILSASVLKINDCCHGMPQDDCASFREKGMHCEKILGAVLIAGDITERKKAEEKLRQALKDAIKSREIMTSMLADNNQIRERLGKNLEALEKAQAQLAHAEKMEAIGRMASGVAHEVKNPLGIILQGINYFEEELPLEEKNNREMLQIMKESVKRADGIARALLDFSRAQELSMELWDINAVIKNSINLVQQKFKLNSIEYACELEKGMPKVLMDIGKIEQVFINLFNNAADAMPQGGKLFIRSYLSNPEKLIDQTGKREKDVLGSGEKTIIVEVEDTGVGIGGNTIDKIFDPFFTTKNRTQGTGLGLSITKSIIEMHQGLIHVKSEKGKGAKFTLTFKIPEKREG